MNPSLLRNLIRVYVASRKQETSTLCGIVRLIGWSCVGLLFWWQGSIDVDQTVLIIAGSESVASLINVFLPDSAAKKPTDSITPISRASPPEIDKYRDGADSSGPNGFNS